MCWSADRVFTVFVSFSGGSDPRSARASAVETQFSMFEPASKKARFSRILGVLLAMDSEFDKKSLKLDLALKNPKR